VLNVYSSCKLQTITEITIRTDLTHRVGDLSIVSMRRKIKDAGDRIFQAFLQPLCRTSEVCSTAKAIIRIELAPTGQVYAKHI